MSKTLEDLGYIKEDYGKSYDLFYKAVDYEGYLTESISFDKKRKKIKVFDTVVSLEELKAIYQYCIDNKWI